MNAREAGAHGPRRRLDRARIVRAAIELADERGLEQVTMRELGRRLGVEAASLYNHVAGKGDVLDGMADLVTLEIEVPSEGVEWKEAMRRRAVSARGVFLRHGWAAGLIDSRERSGPNGLCYADRVLHTLLRAGFSPRIAAHAFFALDSYIHGFEQQRSDLSPGDDADTGEQARETLASIPPGAYPSLARVAAEYAERPFDEDAAFGFGLDLILDGLERVLSRA